jgi:trans-aconitate methyltransferase
MPDLMAKAEAAFTEIYRKDLWGLSRMGAVDDRLASYAQVMQDVIVTQNVRSVVEVGCGVWTYAKLVDWRDIEYDGYDVVPTIVEKNIKTWGGGGNIRFNIMNDLTELPRADLVISKDVLQHLPNDDAMHLLSMFKAAAPLSLVVNDIVPNENTNGAIERGGYRAVRLDQAPFNETCETLHEWESTDFGVFCRKRAVILRR